MPREPSSDSGQSPPLDATSWRLLARFRAGESGALEQLLSRYLPRLHRWAHGRLPRWARTRGDTPDLVHDVMLRSLAHLDTVHVQERDALGAYFRAAVRNRIRDEHRRFARRGEHDPLDDQLVDESPSPFDRALLAERRARYLTALTRIDPADRDLIVGHVELGYTHAQLGCMSGRTPNAARMALQRAIARLAAQMRER
jgi:RNA polymerase sigma factor (sigma-70 family)